jgi:NADH dehydrogenase (ubiquinone) 1 beta subcomplex subunit 9
MAAPPSAHTLRVCGIYRRSLKTLFNWVVDRETFIAEAGDLRKQFEANRVVRSAPLVEKICADAEAELVRWKHPDPYKRARSCHSPSLEAFEPSRGLKTQRPLSRRSARPTHAA